MTSWLGEQSRLRGRVLLKDPERIPSTIGCFLSVWAHNGVCTLDWPRLRGFESEAVKNPSLHFACSLTNVIGERTGGTKRRIPHSDSPARFGKTLTRSRKLLLRRVGVGIREPLEGKGVAKLSGTSWVSQTLQVTRKSEFSFTDAFVEKTHYNTMNCIITHI